MQFYIQQERGNLYWVVDASDLLVFAREPSTLFQYTATKRIKVVGQSGKCLRFDENENEAKVMLSGPCNDDFSEWIIQENVLKNPSTQKCIHPLKRDYIEGNQLVIHSGCDPNGLSVAILSKCKVTSILLLRHLQIFESKSEDSLLILHSSFVRTSKI